MKTYRYQSTNAVGATDLNQELAEAQRLGQPAELYSITIYDAAGVIQHPESAEALYLPGEGRLGIAWGADASWADVGDIESGIEMWLNDGPAWEAAN